MCVIRASLACVVCVEMMQMIVDGSNQSVGFLGAKNRVGPRYPVPRARGSQKSSQKMEEVP